MKKIISMIAVSIVFTACSDSKTEVELAKQHLLDSINAAANMDRVVDSMNTLVNPGAAGIESNNIIINPETGLPMPNPAVANTDGATGTVESSNSGTQGGSPNQSTQTDSKGNTSTASTGTTTADKKKMSNKTKGALIGTGAGVIAGAAAGAIIGKDAKSAAIGGAVGGAIGSGVGFGIGAAKDKKATTTKTTTTNTTTTKP